MIEATSIDKRSFSYGQRTIDYSLFFTDRRSLEIAVHPDSTVAVKAPLDSAISLIEKKLHKRARWILRQIDYFRQFNPKTPDRQYINGETHLYLGRQYRLKISHGQKNSVKLIKGFFKVACRKKHNPVIVKKLMNNWYSQKANIQFSESLARCWPKFNAFALVQPSILIRRMKKRWGSLSNKGTVILNPDLIKAPKECIDYVVSHELCHLKHHNHSPEFHMLLDSVIPGWKRIKHKLELSMV